MYVFYLFSSLPALVQVNLKLQFITENGSSCQSYCKGTNQGGSEMYLGEYLKFWYVGLCCVLVVCSKDLQLEFIATIEISYVKFLLTFYCSTKKLLVFYSYLYILSSIMCIKSICLGATTFPES